MTAGGNGSCLYKHIYESACHISQCFTHDILRTPGLRVVPVVAKQLDPDAVEPKASLQQAVEQITLRDGIVMHMSSLELCLIDLQSVRGLVKTH